MKSLTVAFLLLFFPLCLSAAWRNLQPGLDYESRIEISAHVFRIDPAKFRVGLVLASDFKEPALTANEFRERSKAVLAVNGGFFAEAFRAMGLLFRNGKVLNPLRASAWGIFAVTDKGARILHRNDWDPKGVPEAVTAALQVGPRLVVDGAVQKFKPAAPDRRSAVGITSDGKIEIAIAEKPVLMEDWAAFMKRDCPDALNLDGGGSTQIAAKISDWSLNVEGFTAVPDGLAVFPR